MGESPADDAGLVVKLARLRNDAYPGRGAHGVLPLLFVGHSSMTEAAWKGWVRRIGIGHYGAGYVDRVLVHGVELKEMEPTCPFGRQIRMCTEQTWKSRSSRWKYLDVASAIMSAVEKWPSLYNTIAEHMAEQEFTLKEFVNNIRELPSPIGRPDIEGMNSTLGNIINGPIGGRPMVLPDY